MQELKNSNPEGLLRCSIHTPGSNLFSNHPGSSRAAEQRRLADHRILHDRAQHLAPLALFNSLPFSILGTCGEARTVAQLGGRCETSYCAAVARCCPQIIEECRLVLAKSLPLLCKPRNHTTSEERAFANHLVVWKARHFKAGLHGPDNSELMLLTW